VKNIFIVNDDSDKSPGLSVLIQNLEAYNLTVVTTEHFKSWTSKAITYKKEVLIREGSVSNHKAYIIDGYPADCVNIGLNHLVKDKQNLLVSGINIGENATDSWLLSSATVAATLEGAICGIKGIAISQQLSDEMYDEITNNLFNKPINYYEKHFRLSGRVAKTITKYVLENDLPPEIKILSVNVPPQETYQDRWCLTKPYRWSYGSIFSRTSKGYIKTSSGFIRGKVKEQGTDMWALQNGYISITPYDLPMQPVINQTVDHYFSKLPKTF
jgi:5'-nucleotidase